MSGLQKSESKSEPKLRKVHTHDIVKIIHDTQYLWDVINRGFNAQDILFHLFEDISNNGGYVLEIEDKIIGGVIFTKFENWWNYDCFLSNLLFWVHPDYNSLKLRKQLLQKCKEKAKLNGTQFYLEVFDYNRNSGLVTRGRILG